MLFWKAFQENRLNLYGNSEKQTRNPLNRNPTRYLLGRRPLARLLCQIFFWTIQIYTSMKTIPSLSLSSTRDRPDVEIQPKIIFRTPKAPHKNNRV